MCGTNKKIKTGKHESMRTHTITQPTSVLENKSRDLSASYTFYFYLIMQRCATLGSCQGEPVGCRVASCRETAAYLCDLAFILCCNIFDGISIC